MEKCVDVMRVHTEGLKIEMRWKDAIFLRLRKKICKAYSKYGSMCNKAPICICLKCAMRINHFNFFIINLNINLKIQEENWKQCLIILEFICNIISFASI